jgi:hypothetical protein
MCICTRIKHQYLICENDHTCIFQQLIIYSTWKFFMHLQTFWNDNFLHNANLSRENMFGNFRRHMFLFSFKINFQVSELRFETSAPGLTGFYGMTYQNGKSMPNQHKIYQSAAKYTKWSYDIPTIQFFVLNRISLIYLPWKSEAVNTAIPSSLACKYLVSWVPGLPDGIFSNQKIPIWVNFGGSCYGRCWYSIWPFGLFFGYFVYFVATWSMLWLFGTYMFLVFVCCTKKYLATLLLKLIWTCFYQWKLMRHFFEVQKSLFTFAITDHTSGSCVDTIFLLQK